MDRALAFRDDERPRTIDAWLELLPSQGEAGFHLPSDRAATVANPATGAFPTIEFPEDDEREMELMQPKVLPSAD